MTAKQEIILNWFFENTDKLTESTIRKVEIIAEETISNPTRYITEWEESLIEEIHNITKHIWQQDKKEPSLWHKKNEQGSSQSQKKFLKGNLTDIVMSFLP